ncbi:citrate (Si)-synthase [candidate division KSB1 bacterium]|nr:citrate (Si)-synthase [candidate division KSB1 bacterium]
MATLQEKLKEQIPKLREEIKQLVTEHGEKVISSVTVSQAYGGMRGVKGLVCDTSVVEPDIGLIIRGRPILETKLTEKLPEEIFYLLLTGELPDKTALKSLQNDLSQRTEVPNYVWDVLRAMPADSHPMTMLDTAILTMQKESVFAQKYAAGLNKNDYWEPMLEDALRIVAQIPVVAAGVYRIRYRKGNLIPPDKKLDLGANYAHMLGIPDPSGEFANLMRLYLTLHSDHEGGNVSAFTCHTVGSALSDAYYAVSAGLNGLAGPLHGLANQECLGFVLELKERYKGVPTEKQLEEFAWERLNSGQVIPGYGHAVLRVTDPRFTAFREFGERVCPEDPVFKIVSLLFKVVPQVLMKQGKAKNPWPNVDAGSGALLYHFGLTEFAYYTVLFSVSRAMGMLSQLVLNRALGTPITRPKSVSTEWMKQTVKNM